MRKFIRQLFCEHNYQTVCNIYGDAIIKCNWNRSIKKCTRCGKEKYDLHLDPDCTKTYTQYIMEKEGINNGN